MKKRECDRLAEKSMPCGAYCEKTKGRRLWEMAVGNVKQFKWNVQSDSLMLGEKMRYE
jgi:hypothetical protein